MAIRWDDQPLGQLPDTELAERLGVSGVAVGKARRRRGIPAYSPTGHPLSPRGQGQRAGVVWDDQPLGLVPDKELARRLGVDPSSVRSARMVRERKAREVKAAMDRPRPPEEMAADFNAALSVPAPEPWDPQEVQAILAREDHDPHRWASQYMGQPLQEEEPEPPEEERRPRPRTVAVPALPVHTPRPEPRERTEPIVPGGWLTVATQPPGRPPAPRDPRPMATTSEATRAKPRPRELGSSHHAHRCPVCRRWRTCVDPSCELGLETDDGDPMSWRTCDRCVRELGRETTGHVIPVGGTFGSSGKL